MITSLANPRVHLARSLLTRRGRRQEGAFLLEGTRLITDAITIAPPRLVFYGPDYGKRERRERYLLDQLRRAGAEVQPVSDRVLRAITSTVTPQGVVAVVPFPSVAPDAAVTPLVLVLDRLTDPGNVGAVLRVAAAAGVTEVLALRGDVDLWHPKVVRAAAGAHFHVLVRQDLDWTALDDRLARIDQRWLADPRGGVPYWEPDWTAPSALVIANEAHGATSAAVQWTSGRAVTVPMVVNRRIDSLNVGVAAGIILFEALRQRTAERSARRRQVSAPSQLNGSR